MINFTNMYKARKDINLELSKNFDLACNNADFIKLCNNLKLDKKVLMKYTSKLENTVKELEKCKNCSGLGNCCNKIMGYVSYPKIEKDNLIFSYKACKYKKEEKIINNNKYFETPLNLRNACMKDIDLTDKNRIEVIKYLKKFIDSYLNDEKLKGIYLHGNFGCGKSYLISAMINELNKKDISSIIVYYPKLLKDLKESLNDYSFKYKINELLKIEILLIDDIGAETNTNFSRDEILGTILQTRMDNNLSTFFTSNLSINELREHLSLTREKSDIIKSTRIIERIKQLTVDMELISVNKRK